MTDAIPNPPGGQLVIFQDGATRLQVRLDGQTAWLSQSQLAELYQTTIQNVSLHIQHILEDGELVSERTVKQYLIVRREGNRDVSRAIAHYSLPMILAIGYRVRSARGTAFRQWATARLSELLVKGFTLDDERIKAGSGRGADSYFEELLERIRDIRSSERLFYQKITDIYATSIDYDPSAEATKRFFQTVQNKLHWAAHGHTAAEIVAERADSGAKNMGLTAWRNSPGGKIRKADVTIAKNYLRHEELAALNQIVSAYLEFAEVQAKLRRPMHMSEWISKLDEFLRLTESGILTHLGKVSHEVAAAKAELEFDRFDLRRRELESNTPTSDFDRMVQETRRIAKKGPDSSPKDTLLSRKRGTKPRNDGA